MAEGYGGEVGAGCCSSREAHPAPPTNPHAVLLPYPLQGHLTPMLQLAKILAFRGFAITVVNNEFIHSRLISSVQPHWLSSIRLVAIPDGLGAAESRVHLYSNRERILATENQAGPFAELLEKFRHESHPVTCIISDSLLCWTQDVADKLGIPRVVLWTSSVVGFLPFFHMRQLVSRGYLPIKAKDSSSLDKEENYVTDIPGFPSNFKISDLPSYIQVEDLTDFFWQHGLRAMDMLPRAACLIFNSFEELEGRSIDATRRNIPVFAIGPLLASAYVGTPEKLGVSFWKEDDTCLGWLDMQSPSSVLYISFGSLAIQSTEKVEELALGIEASNLPFLWVIRPNTLKGKTSAFLPDGFLCRTAGRGRVISWAPQHSVLSHSSVGGFLTHCGWNSILESIFVGVPMIGYPSFAEQRMNCILLMQEWGIGTGFPDGSGRVIGRQEVEKAVRTVMTEEEGREMRKKVCRWRETARRAVGEQGSSQGDLDRFVKDMVRRMEEKKSAK